MTYLDIINIGDTCRTHDDRAARYVGGGMALYVTPLNTLALGRFAPARGGEMLRPMPSDLEVCRASMPFLPPYGKGRCKS